MDQNTKKRTLYELVGPGLAAGWAAGIVVLLVAMAHAAAAGLGPIWPVEVAVDGLVPERNDSGMLAALLGLITWFVVSGVLGVLFNALTPRGVSYGWAGAFGLIYAFGVFVIVRWLVLPLWSQPLFQSVNPFVLLGYHLLFGLVVPLAIPLRRNVTRAEQDQQFKT